MYFFDYTVGCPLTTTSSPVNRIETTTFETTPPAVEEGLIALGVILGIVVVFAAVGMCLWLR